ncbi:unnamed protein product [Microthlaspi erraticum]|uniref:Integrase catalytic domain-containing protein n=1 Tax=Microthlaspi erraticum TaxID=1685480 RepID=A0A6D2IPY7_9BRAS|nr:unnamed protein product [Microthlaspi erraticum]
MRGVNSFSRTASLDVVGHVDGTTVPNGDNDGPWQKRDGLVKLWIYGTLTPPLFKKAFQAGDTARDIWLRIENLFRNNKEARAIQLDTELRTTEIGDRSVEDYCQRLKSISDLLKNVDAPVPDRMLVTYMLNGLNDKFDNIINVIKHREPFPTFEVARSMLESEETRLKKSHKTVASQTDHPSSSAALTVSSDQPKFQRPPAPKISNHRGNRRNNGTRFRGRHNFSPRPTYPNWATNQYWPGPVPQWQYQFGPWNPYPFPNDTRGIMGPRPSPPRSSSANVVDQVFQPTTDFSEAYNTMTLPDPSATNWFMDTGATTHLASTPGNSLITSQTRPLSLNNVLVTPQIVKNLISVRRFTIDNWCSVEFDPFGFCVKDLQTRRTLLRSDSTGDLYPLPASSSTSQSTALTASSLSLWHKRLGHLNNESLRSVISFNNLACNKDSLPLCTACQLGKQIKLPFFPSQTIVSKPFELIHSDVWTSPVSSISGLRYYVLFLDHYTHFLWVYPLRRKSEVFSKFLHFYSHIQTQFNSPIKAFQCDNGGEYNNTDFHKFFDTNGIQVRFSCPHTSQQNGKSERMIRTINNSIRSLLFQAKLSPAYWVEALHVAVHLINILPSSAIQNQVPYTLLFQKPPTYDHLKVFGCLCFPNLNHSNLHKLSPRTTPCLFLGYPSQHRGYRCLDLKTNRIIISRHVAFDESIFPAAVTVHDPPSLYQFLNGYEEPSPMLHSLLQTPLPQTPPQPPNVPAPPPPPNVAAPPQPPVIPAPSQPTHQMATRSKHGIRKPRSLMSLLVTSKHSVSPLPLSYKQALSDPNWNPAATEEFNALLKSKTWDLVPRPHGVNIIKSMWLFKHKFNADGAFARYKARLVANGKSQEAGVDFDETFSPVFKPATIRSVLHVSLARDWPIHQLDVQNAFLHGDLEETIYMFQPPGFADPKAPDHVCKLKRSLYGLKQAPRAWNSRFARFMTNIGFVASKSDASLFIYRKGDQQAYLLLYVDDIVLTASTKELLQHIIKLLKTEFPMTDMGRLHYFLGIKAEFKNGGIFLSQSAYALDIIERAGMKNCKPCATPVDLKSKLSANSGDRIDNPTAYRSLAGALQYLTFTRPDISYAVNQICLFMHDPREQHLQALKRILRYVQGTHTHGLHLQKGSINDITAYSDADWAGCPDTRRSSSGYCLYLGPNLVSWSSKRQPTVSRSSAEAEYKGVANAVAEACWLRNLLLELHCPITKASVIYCDNISAVYLSSNPVKHQRTKHIEIDIHFVREKVKIGQVKVFHVPSSLQFADIFTKGLPTMLFNDFRDSLTVRNPNVLTAGG